MTLSGGFAVMPEQSTVAIIAHHPQAVYFGMKSGFIPEEKVSDELIAGTERGGELPPEVEPDEGGDEEAKMRPGRRRRSRDQGWDQSLAGRSVGPLPKRSVFELGLSDLGGGRRRCS